jgi:predicted metal-dependent peptidase
VTGPRGHRAPPEEPPALRSWLDGFLREASFLARYPYYAHVLAGLEPVADPSVPAMGLSLHPSPGRGGRYYLHVNVEQFLREPQFLRGILLHEVHHVVLGHLAHPKFFGAERPELMLLAQETSANEYIDEALPSPVLWQHFAQFGLRAGQSTLERYERLCAARAQGAEVLPKRDTRLVDEHRWRQQPAAPPGGVQQTKELIERAREEGADDAKRVSAGRPESATLAGRTPEELLLQLVGTTDAPEVYVDWRAALRAFVAQARAPVHTWARPSRRFPSRIGELPGRTYRLRDVLRPTLVVAIDTSLSMTREELAEVARQLRPLSQLTRLVIVECDAAITRVYPFAGTLESVKGRGGTDLRPVFDPRFLGAHGADGVIYFTDGDGPYPETAPRVPTLWMLTKPGEFECPWGLRARLTRATAPRR